MTPAPASTGASEAAQHRPVPRRRPRSGDRRSLPPHPRDRRAARPGRDRLRLGRARRAGLGEGAAPRVAGHARPGHSRRRSRVPAARCSASATGSKPTSPPGTSAGCCSPATSGVDEDDEGFTAGQAARMLARAEAGWGRATYGLVARPARARATRRAPTIPTCRTTTAQTRRTKAEQTGACSRLDHRAGRRRFPSRAATATVPLQAVVDGALEFLERSTARSSALDHAPRPRCVEYIERAARARRVLVLAARGAALHPRARRVAARSAPERPRPGHLYACRLSQAGYAGRPHLFVVGLEEGRVFPRRPRTRCCSTPSARRSRRRCGCRPTGSTKRCTPCSRGSRRRSGAGDASTFSYSCRDTREFRETYASWLMLQAFRLQQGDATLSYPADEGRARRAEVGRARRPRRGALRRRLVAAQRRRHRRRRGVAVARRGVRRRRARARAPKRSASVRAFTEFDGHVPGGGHGARSVRAAATRSRSPSSRRRPSCPFRFFLKRGLGHSSRGRARARQGRLARSADARLGAARPLRRAAAPLPRRRTVGRT